MADAYATAADIAHMLHITTGYVYLLAHRHKWRRTYSLPRRYNLDDVEATWENRQVKVG